MMVRFTTGPSEATSKTDVRHKVIPWLVREPRKNTFNVIIAQFCIISLIHTQQTHFSIGVTAPSPQNPPFCGDSSIYYNPCEYLKLHNIMLIDPVWVFQSADSMVEFVTILEH